jgi:hypothetical protein
MKQVELKHGYLKISPKNGMVAMLLKTCRIILRKEESMSRSLFLDLFCSCILLDIYKLLVKTLIPNERERIGKFNSSRENAYF